MSSRMDAETAQIPGRIRENAAEYWAKVEEIYEEIKQNVGGQPDEKLAWYGQRAGEFVQETETFKQELQQQKASIETAAENLENHVQTWTRFQQG